jgi:drug/metabolite transporter (DMT)-like permease
VEKEHVGWRRLTAVAVGFLGAMIVIRPSYGVFGAVSLLPLGTAGIFSVYLLLNKRFSSADTPLSMQLSAGIGGTLTMTAAMALGLAIGEPNLMPERAGLPEWSLLALMGLLATVGHLMVIAAFRRAPASVLAPFQYLEIVGATILGYALFGDFPDFWKWAGILTIVASGAYVFWRESRVQ